MTARRRALLGAVALATLGSAVPASAAPYLVLYDDPANPEPARTAIAAAGGTVLHENPAVGLAEVAAPEQGFLGQVSASPAVSIASRDRAPQAAAPAAPPTLPFTAGAADPASPGTAEPLAPLQWDMTAIRAPEARAAQAGSPRVLVGVLSGGVDRTHPEVARGVVASLSRTFTGGASPTSDQIGDGTHLAGIVAGRVNREGIAGVAPGVSLVSLRVADGNGRSFVSPVVDAITYAADAGVDVLLAPVRLDPWRFVCSTGAEPKQQLAEQRLIRAAVRRAVADAKARGVFVVGAVGDDHTSLDDPRSDSLSPTVPNGAAQTRALVPGCDPMPVGVRGVAGTSSLGPSGRLAEGSNHGLQAVDLAAPGGDRGDFPDDPLSTGRYENMVLGPYPTAVARARGELAPDGTPLTPAVVRDCTGSPCSYYVWRQGTDVAAAHVAGAAALVVSRRGAADPVRGGLTLAPDAVWTALSTTAVNRPCPVPPVITFPGRGPDYDAPCIGTTERNSIVGEGTIDAAAALGG
jgi:hypothetical protein